ncbi:MAG: c-type cytochrome [bacterium]
MGHDKRDIPPLRIRTILVAMTALVIATIVAAPAARAQDADGKKIFVAQKCNRCHKIESQGVAIVESEDPTDEEGDEPDTGEKRDPPDLSNVGAEKDKLWIAKFLVKQETLDGRKHKKRFRGTKDELKVVAEWLGGLKK